jgi:sugar phosphate isomerase/epimerase
MASPAGKKLVFMRTPGFGDSNWTDIISELRLAGWPGSIDIEGWHDPVYCDELELTGQIGAFNSLKTCRGGRYVPDPCRWACGSARGSSIAT